MSQESFQSGQLKRMVIESGADGMRLTIETEPSGVASSEKIPPPLKNPFA